MTLAEENFLFPTELGEKVTHASVRLLTSLTELTQALKNILYW